MKMYFFDVYMKRAWDNGSTKGDKKKSEVRHGVMVLHGINLVYQEPIHIRMVEFQLIMDETV